MNFPDSDKIKKLAKSLFHNSDRPTPPVKKETDSSKEFELFGLDQSELEEDLHGGPLIRENFSDGETRIFGKYTQEQVHMLMEWSGIFQALHDKGYSQTDVELQYLSDQDQRIFVREKDEVLIHIRLKLSSFHFRLHPGAPRKKLLYIDWLMTRHPHTKKLRRDRLFPGQDMPGLGIFGHISDFITNMALGVGAKGAFNIPEYFHDAVLFHRQFRFYDPVREAFFRALLRDLRKHGIREISHALSENRVISGHGDPVSWTPAEMISALDPELEETLWRGEFFTKVVRELKRNSFKILEKPAGEKT